MKIKNLKVSIKSLALSALMSGNIGYAMSTPAYADELPVEELTLVEKVLDEEEDEELEENVVEITLDDNNVLLGTFTENDVVEEIEEVEEVQDEVVNEVIEEEQEEEILEEVQEVQEEELEELEEEETNLEEEVTEKECPECGTVLAVDATECIECGHVFEVIEENELEQEEELDENELEEEEEKEEEENLDEESLVAVGGVMLLSAELEEQLEEIINEENEREEDVSVKTAVITSKLDEKGDPLVGATLQILDKDGNVLDEWISDGTEHISMLPEGEYILHEKDAPEGYEKADDKTFKVEIPHEEVIAGVDHDDSHDVCWHYSGVALYFIESEGVKEEVYCINQNWDEPDGNQYDGTVLDDTNIRVFAPESDTTMTDIELYHKVLDIIYHRSKAEEMFPDLSETEIRFITEYALKTYTSAGVTTRQARRDENGHLVYDDDGQLIYDDIPFLRYYSYDPTSPKGYVIDPENGNGIGKLAEHWYNQHGKQIIPEEYVALYYYLVGDEEYHPEDMHLYVYTALEMAGEDEAYQNLVGIRWFNPEDDEVKTFLTMVDLKEQTPPPPTPPCPPHKPCHGPKTGDTANPREMLLALLVSGTGVMTTGYLLTTDGKKRKVRTNK